MKTIKQSYQEEYKTLKNKLEALNKSCPLTCNCHKPTDGRSLDCDRCGLALTIEDL